MTLRTLTLKALGFSLFSFVLGVALFAATTPAVSVVVKEVNTQDDRAADREAIRAHIDSIFQAFIRKDAAALRGTHAQNWLGYLEGSRDDSRAGRLHGLELTSIRKVPMATDSILGISFVNGKLLWTIRNRHGALPHGRATAPGFALPLT